MMLLRRSRLLYGLLLVVGLAVVAGGLWALRSDRDETPDTAELSATSTSEPAASSIEVSVSPTTTTTPVGVTVLAPLCVQGPAGYLQAPDDWYRAEPVYGNDVNEFNRAVREYAATLDGFERQWNNPERNRWIHVGFVGVDVAQRQRELEAKFPGVGVVAVELDHTADELAALAVEVEDLLPDGMAVAYTHEKAGTIDVWVGKVTEQDRALLAPLLDDYPLCATGYVGDRIGEAGPQRTSGDGWRLLAQVEERGLGQRAPAVTTDADLEDLWTNFEIDDPLPLVEWQSDIVVAFEAVYGSSCPETRFEGVISEGGQIRAIIIDPTLLKPGATHPACTSDYNARVYVVTVARELLPAPPFTIKGSPRVTQEVPADVDLRQPGTTFQP